MTRREAERLNRQREVLISLGFTAEEAESLRRISMTLQRWYERECNGEIERDEHSGIPQRRYADDVHKLYGYPIPDRERGAEKRLAAILSDVNSRLRVKFGTVNDKARQGNLSAYLQTDPRGAALYILRPGDVPAGQDASSYYSRGICVY